MANDVKFVRGQGGLGRPLPNKDHVSALAFPVPTGELPYAFTATDRCKKVFSLGEAEALGILSTSDDASVKKLHYQVSEFFRMQPQGELYIYLYNPGTNINVVMTTVVAFPENGEIRLLAVMSEMDPQDGTGAVIDDNFVALVGAAQAVANNSLDTHKPLSILLATDKFEDPLDLNTLPDLRAQNAPNVSFVIGHDAGGLGAELEQPALGAFLGAIARASVHESIAWVERFNFSNGTELEKLAVCYAEKVVTPTTPVEFLGMNGYLTLKKHIGVAGSYSYDSATCALATSDYAFIENERTMDKATRNIRAKTLPSLARPLYLEGGLLREDTVAFFKATASEPLAQMQRDGEISEFSVTINPAQPILQTSKLEIGVKIVPVGVAREIEFTIGFAVKVS